MKISGNLENTGLFNLLMIIKMLEKTGFLTITRGYENAILYFENGELVSANLNDLEGNQVINNIINWNRGTYNFAERLVSPVSNIVNGTVKSYKEALRRFFVYSVLNKINITLGDKHEKR